MTQQIAATTMMTVAVATEPLLCEPVLRTPKWLNCMSRGCWALWRGFAMVQKSFY
jgi:hypothetical protein